MMWPFRQRRVERLFGSLLGALETKDADLRARLGHLCPDKFWREWKKHHPEDFPMDGQSSADASSIMSRVSA